MLNEATGRGKATFFLRLGFRSNNWQTLVAALMAQARDVGVVLHVHRNGEAFEVELSYPRPGVYLNEFMTLDGNTLMIETLTAKQIRAARNRGIPHVRERTVAA